MTRTSRRARTFGLAMVALGAVSTSVGVARGSGSGGPSAPEPAIVSAHRCGIRDRRLLPEGSVLVIVPCLDEPSPRCPGG